ncbi:hypothetical protein K9L97_05600 [Candidatus Woesearchaeota archaeon]|nr:hypothetical protein [Candidatus Woesearchaeota archaeon]
MVEYYPRTKKLLELELENSNPKIGKKYLEEYTEKEGADFRWLDKFLQYLGTDNLLEIINNTEFLEIDLGGNSGEKEKRGTSLSQQDLYDSYVWVKSKITNESIISGKRIIPTIFKTLNKIKLTDEYKILKQKIEFLEKEKKEIQKETKQSNQKSRYNFERNIEDLIENEKTLKNYTTPRERQKIHAIIGLDKKTQETYKKLDALIAQGITFDIETDKELLNLDPSGGPVSYIKKLEKQGEKIEPIILEYANSMNSQLAEPLRKLRYTLLLEYVLKRKKFSIKAIEPLLKDAEHIAKLKPENEFIKKYGYPDLEQIKKIQEKKYLNLDDIQRFVNTNIIFLRKKLNEEYISSTQTNKEDYEKALEFFKEKIYDLENQSIKKTFYDATLNRTNKKIIKETLKENQIMQKETQNITEKELILKQHEEFKKTINAIIIEYRKAKYLENFKKENPEIDEKEIKAQLKYLRKDEYEPKETLNQTTTSNLEERIIEKKYELKNPLNTTQKELLKYGLLDKEILKNLKNNKYKKTNKTELEYLSRLTSKQETLKLKNAINNIKENFLVLSTNKKNYEENFLEPEIYEKNKIYIELDKKLKEEQTKIQTQNKKDLEELEKQNQKYQNRKFLELQNKTELNPKLTNIKDIIENEAETLQETQFTKTHYLTQKTLLKINQELKQTTHLNEEQKQKLLDIWDITKKDLLKELNYTFEKGSYYKIKEATQNNYQLTPKTQQTIQALHAEITNKITTYLKENLTEQTITGSTDIQKETTPLKQKYFINIKEQNIFEIQKITTKIPELYHDTKWGLQTQTPQTKAKIAILANKLQQYNKENDTQHKIKLKKA